MSEYFESKEGDIESASADITCNNIVEKDTAEIINIQEDIVETDELPALSNSENVFNEIITEIPEDIEETNCLLVDASEITGIDFVNDDFWDHHGNTKKDYIDLASGLKEVQERLSQGETMDSLSNDDLLRRTVEKYYGSDNIIRVNKTENGYELDGDGRHRVMAARELGYSIPVVIRNR